MQDIDKSAGSTAGRVEKSVIKPSFSLLRPGPGFRIRTDFVRPDREIVAGLGMFDTPDVSDVLNRLYTMCSLILPVTKRALRLAGPACTVKVFPGDNLMVHKALDIAQPGDVLVVDASSSTINAVLGELVCTKARCRGIQGMVVDGLVRDVGGIEALADFPVFARGVTPIGPLQRGPGEINQAVCAGGIVVQPGDVVIGDINGVVVVPGEVSQDVLDQLIARSTQSADYLAAVARGEFSNEWVDRILEDAGLSAPGSGLGRP